MMKTGEEEAGKDELEDLSIEEQLLAARVAGKMVSKLLVSTAVAAESAMRTLLSLARRHGIPEETLIRNLMGFEEQIVAELKAGRFDVEKFGRRPGEEPLDLIVPTKAEGPHDVRPV